MKNDILSHDYKMKCPNYDIESHNYEIKVEKVSSFQFSMPSFKPLFLVIIMI